MSTTFFPDQISGDRAKGRPLWRAKSAFGRTMQVALLCAAHGGILHAHLIAMRAGHGLHRLWIDAARKSLVSA